METYEEEEGRRIGGEEEREENNASRKPKCFTQWLTYHLIVCVIRPGRIRNNVKGSSHALSQSIIRGTQYNTTAQKTKLRARCTGATICTCRT
jgi:hypothetical protein